MSFLSVYGWFFLAIACWLPYPLPAMPLTKSAMKRVRQSEKRRDALRPFKTRMKNAMRSLQELAKAGKKDEAAKLLPTVSKVLDTAAKKYIIHWKNAAHKKSQAALLVAKIGK